MTLLGSGLLIIGSVTLLVFLSWITYLSARLLKVAPPPYNILLSPAENMARVLVLLVCVLIGIGSGAPPAALGWRPQAPWFDVGIGLLIGLGIQTILNAGTTWAIHRFGKGIYDPVVIRNIVPRRPGEWPAIMLALIPAVLLEEVLFRSLLVGGLSFYLPAFLLALVVSLVFGIMHVPQGILGVIATSIIGMVLSLLFIWRSSIVITVAAHYAINLLQLKEAERQRAWLDSY